MDKRENSVKADMVIVGAGGSGLVAAIASAEGGASVIIFEKTNTYGPLDLPVGGQPGPGGPFAAESKMQRRKYIGLTRDEAFKNIMDYSHWRANARLVRAFVDKSASTIEWLEKRGVEFLDNSPVPLFVGSHSTWHFVKGGGAALPKILVARAKEKGVEIRLETPVKKIFKDGNRIGGVIAEDKSGKTMQVNSKVVIIATGGYGNNKEWIKKYTGFDLGHNLFPPGELGLTGDGIQMAWEVGAAEEGMGVLIHQFALIGPGIWDPQMQLRSLTRQPYLWINQQGERFCDEDIVVRHWPFAGNAIAKQKNGCTFLIFDGNTKKYLEEEGLDYGMAISLPSSTKIVDLDAQIKKCLDKGNENIFVTNSLEELGRKIVVDPDVLQKTVNEYNKFCEKGHDDLFAKNPKFLYPVKKPKFYAFRFFQSFLATLGGIKINEKTEVLNKEGEIIPGLYAAGNDSNGLYGDSYDVWLPATAFGFAVNSGRIAAENALKYIGR